MSAMARTWQAAPSDAEGCLAWGHRALYSHTVLHTLLHLTCMLRELQQAGKQTLSRCLETHVVFSPAGGPLRCYVVQLCLKCFVEAAPREAIQE